MMETTTPQSFIDGYRLIDGTELNKKLGNPQWSTTTSVTATAGGNVNTSVVVIDAITNITSAAPNAGITIPQALPGKVLVVSNSTANPVIVYAAGGSTIGGVPGNVGTVLPAYQTLYIFAVDLKQWMFSYSLPTQLSAQTVTPALKALQPVALQTIDVAGYYAVGDGGGGQFYGVTGAAPGTYVDNGGTIILPTGGNGSSAWLRIYDTPINVLWFGADRSGVADSTARIQAAINVFTSGNGAIFFPPGIYKITSTISIVQNRLHLYGAGVWATQILFNPTADDICFFFGKGGEGSTDDGIMVQNSIKGMNFFTNDQTHKKTAIEFKDCTLLEVDSIAVGASSQWSGNNSIGIRTRGRDSMSFGNLYLAADTPFSIARNTNFPSLSLDQCNFNNILTSCAGFYTTPPDYTRANFFFEPGANFSNVSFTGYQAWLNGKYGMYYDNSTLAADGASYALNIENVRWEGTEGLEDTGYGFYFDQGSVSEVTNISFKNIYMGEIGQGYYFRRFRDITLDSCVWLSNSRKALDIEKITGNERLQINNCFWQTGSTASIVDFTLINGVRGAVTAGILYSTALYSASTSAYRRDYIIGVPINQGVITVDAPDPTVITLPLAAGASVVGIINDSRSKVAIIAFLATTKTITFIYMGHIARHKEPQQN
jgi:hypothetical protein